jgi:hypothetical protein
VITLLLLLGSIALLLLNVVLLLLIKTMRTRVRRELEEERDSLSYNVPPTMLGDYHGGL